MTATNRYLRLVFAAVLVCLAIPASASASGPKDRVVITGPVVVERGDTSGDVVVADGDVVVRGTVDGNLYVANGEVTLRGKVTGDVVTLADRVVFGTRGRVQGDLYYGDKKPEGAAGKVDGDVKKVDVGSGGFGLVIALWVAFTVSALILGLLLLLVFPRAADAVGRAGRASPGGSFLWGLLLFFALPILGVLGLVSVVGIPFGFGVLLAVLPAYAIAYVSAAFVLGRRILADKPRILAFLVGLVILRLLALIPIAGGIVWFLATVFGLGALVVGARRARSA